MKKIILLVFVVLSLFFVNLIDVNAEIKGESGGSMGGNSVDLTNKDSEKYEWSWPGDVHAIEITIYTKDTGKRLKTLTFLNNKNKVNVLNQASQANQVWVKGDDEEEERLNENYKPKGVWKKSGSNYFKYLAFENYIKESTEVSIVNALKGDKEEAVEEAVYEILDLSDINEDKENLVLVVEPATTFIKKDGTLYFGTYWDFMYLFENTSGDYTFSWVLNKFFTDDLNQNIFGRNLSIAPGEITQTKTEGIWDFLSTNPKFGGFKSDVATTRSLGVAIILLTDVLPAKPNEKDCETIITKVSCNTDFRVEEPTDIDCVVNNSKNIYKAVGDCGTIYCSENISTDLNRFYQTFTPIIKSGGYFKMNSVKVDVTRTCYLKALSNSAACNSWHNNIKEEEAGTLGLTLVSNYTLVKNSNTSSFKVKCDSYSNGKCTKATSEQHIEYVLEPNTNRYISIKNMASTLNSSGLDVYDLGGERLTTPISLSTGKHNYEINYQNNRIFSNSIKRLTNITIELDKQKLTLNYSHTQQLTLDDLKYSCSYTAKNSGDDCPAEECCEDGKIIPCPCVCDSVTGCDEDCNPNPPECDCGSECCDSKCNPIDCSECDPDIKPCGFPNVVYRPINLEKAFPGQDGTGRDYGSNWRGHVYDKNGDIINKPNGIPYTKEEYYVNNNRGYKDYDIYQAEPLYVINLDYDTLKYIREYNKFTNHDYNDVKLECKDGEKCISHFLRGIVSQTDSKYNRNLITDGTCKNINNSNFDTCIIRIGA